MAYSAFGIDLGTSNIKIYSNFDNSILNERNMIAIEGREDLFAYGDSAYEMYEKAPDKIHISRPLTNGVIAEIHNMQTVLEHFISDICDGRAQGADYYIAVPTDVTEVEKRAFYDLVRDSSLRAKKIMVVEKAIADGLGMGVDVKTSQAVFVVDCGYATTEISILSLGGIVLSKLIKNGGAKFDDDIKGVIRKEFSLMIGEKTAEQVRMNLAQLVENKEEAVCYGRDIISGLPVERSIPTDLIFESMRDHYMNIIDNIKMILERTPPELAADIYKRGIFVTGGASSTYMFAKLIEDNTKLKVNLAQNPNDTVAVGLSRVIKEEQFRSVAYSIEGMSV